MCVCRVCCAVCCIRCGLEIGGVRAKLPNQSECAFKCTFPPILSTHSNGNLFEYILALHIKALTDCHHTFDSRPIVRLHSNESTKVIDLSKYYCIKYVKICTWKCIFNAFCRKLDADFCRRMQWMFERVNKRTSGWMNEWMNDATSKHNGRVEKRALREQCWVQLKSFHQLSPT